MEKEIAKASKVPMKKGNAMRQTARYCFSSAKAFGTDQEYRNPQYLRASSASS